VSFRFREAAPADAALIAETADVCFETYEEFAPGWRNPTSDFRVERLAERLASPEVWCLLAFDGDEPAGHGSLAEGALVPAAAPPPGHAKVWQLFVRPRWHGTGLAAELLRAVEREATERGFARMALWTPRDSGRARRFYEREGWTPSGREQPESPMGLPLVEYVRTLLR
jgi:GNAT superfamily N-acetyltransferase